MTAHTRLDAHAERAAQLWAPRRVDRVLRIADITVAATLGLLTLPATVAIAATIRVVDGPPVLYRGVRLGQGHRPFVMRKFRTLKVGAEERLGGLYGEPLEEATLQEETRLAPFLRATQLDELPQLWNVLVGDMSMVGPRPLRPVLYAQLEHLDPQRFAVRPGLTGFAQLRRDSATRWEEKLAHDLEYVADRSLGLYAQCCLATAAHMASRAVRLWRDAR